MVKETISKPYYGIQSEEKWQSEGHELYTLRSDNLCLHSDNWLGEFKLTNFISSLNWKFHLP